MKKLKTIKQFTLFGFAILMGLLIWGGIFTRSIRSDVFATAEETAEFKMYEGASVRRSTEDDELGSGIRFGAWMTKAYFDGLSNAESVVLESVARTTINGEEKTFEHVWQIKGENSVEMEFDENGKRNFYHAIMFNDLLDSEGITETEASALDWSVEMTLTVDGEKRNADTAETVDTARSARIVAYSIYVDGERTDAELEGYIGGGVEATLSSVDDYVFLEEKGEFLEPTWGEQAEHSKLALYHGLKKIGFNKNITAEDFGELGETKKFTAFDENNKIYKVTAMYVSKAITKTDDLQIFELSQNNEEYYVSADGTCKIAGYYVLANNLEYVETWESNVHTLANDGYFSGTFDGLGHTMEFNAQAGGLFGNVIGGNLKNTEMICHLSTGDNTTSIVNLDLVPVAAKLGNGEKSGAAVVDNLSVCVSAVDFGAGNNERNCFGFASEINDFSSVTNTVIKIETQLPIVNANTGLFFKSLGEENVNLSSVFFFTEEKSALGGNEKKAFYAANDQILSGENVKSLDGIRRYTTLEDMQEDIANCSVSGFSSAYWQKVGGVPIWKNNINIEWKGVEETVEIGAEFSVSATVGGLDVLIRGIESYNDEIIETDGLTIRAIGVGTTDYRVKYALDGKTYSKTFTLEVTAVSITIEEKIDCFSAADGELKGTFFKYGESVFDIVSATQLVGNYEMPLRIENGNILGVIPKISDVTTKNVAWSSTTYCEGAVRYSKSYLNQPSETLTGSGSRPIYDKSVLPVQITVKTREATYILKDVMAYTKVIDDASDWSVLFTPNAVGTYNKSSYEYVDGYYILGNDIDFKGASVDAPKWTPFRGVFDGNGKTVKNFVTTNGLFGLLNYHETLNGKDAVVKNAAFVGTSSDFGVFGQYIAKRTSIYNLYMSVKLTAADAAVLTANLDCNTVLENVIIEVEDVTGQKRTGGLLAATASGATFCNRAFRGVYLLVKDNAKTKISQTQLIRYATTNGSYSLEMYADNVDIHERGQATSSLEYVGKIAGIYQHESTYAVTGTTGEFVLGNWKITETKDGSFVTARSVAWVNN